MCSFILFVGCLSVAQAKRPETLNPYAYISQAGAVGFSQSGQALLPSSVLQGMQKDSISPIMQLVLENHLVNECIEKVIKQYPLRRDPFVTAKVKYDEGLCQLGKCFQQAMLVSLLPSMAGSSGGGSADQGQLAKMLAQAFQQQKGCGNSSDNGLDPMLLSLLLGR